MFEGWRGRKAKGAAFIGEERGIDRKNMEESVPDGSCTCCVRNWHQKRHGCKCFLEYRFL